MGVLISRQVGCVQFPLMMQFPLCSGRGKCILEINGTETIINTPSVPGSQCVCDVGWSGHNDYLDMRTHDCGINTMAVYVIWSFILVSCIITLALCLYKLIISCMLFQNMRKKPNESSVGSNSSQLDTSEHRSSQTGTSTPPRLRPSRKKPPTWRSFFQWRIVIVSLLTCIPALGMMGASIYRLLNIERGYATDLPMTILFMSGGIPFWTAYRNTSKSWLRVRKKLIRFTAQDQQAAKAATIRLEKMLRLAAVPEFIEVVLSILLCYQQQNANLIIFIYFHVQFLTMSLSCYAFIQAAKSIEHVLKSGLQGLDDSTRSGREKALKRIQTLIKDEKKIASGAIPFALLVAWWPFLRSKHAYSWFQMAFGNLSLIERVWIVNTPGDDDETESHNSNSGGGGGGRSPRNAPSKTKERSHSQQPTPSISKNMVLPPGHRSLSPIDEDSERNLIIGDGAMVLTGEALKSTIDTSNNGDLDVEMTPQTTPPESPSHSVSVSPRHSVPPSPVSLRPTYEPIPQLDLSLQPSPSLLPSTQEPCNDLPIFNPYQDH